LDPYDSRSRGIHSFFFIPMFRNQIQSPSPGRGKKTTGHSLDSCTEHGAPSVLLAVPVGRVSSSSSADESALSPAVEWRVSRSVLQWPIEHPWADMSVSSKASFFTHSLSSPLHLGIHPMTKFFQSLKRKDRWKHDCTWCCELATFSAVRRFLLDLSVSSFVVVVVVNKHSLQLRLRLQESNYCILLVSFYCFRLIVSESDCCVSN
jgi:hypothetical protein